MHELDQMTPNQRLNAFMTGQSMDRMLAMPVIVSMSGDVCGMTHREKRSSPENEAKCQIDSITGRDKDCTYSLINCSSVHVNCCSKRKHK